MDKLLIMRKKFSKYYKVLSIRNIFIITLLAVGTFFYFTFKLSSLQIKETKRINNEPIIKKEIFWILSKNLSCISMSEILPKKWRINIEKENKIINCDNNKIYNNKLEFFEDFLKNHGEKIIILNNYLNIFLIKKLINDTLIIHNRLTHEGKICKNLPESITIESNNLEMIDWNIQYHIKDENIQLSSKSNIIFHRNAFWLFPIWTNRNNINKALGILKKYSFIKNLHNPQVKELDIIQNSINIQCKTEMKLPKCLEKYYKGNLLNNITKIMDKYNYNWPKIKDFENFKDFNCTRIFWKIRGNLTMKDENCNQIKIKDKLLRQTGIVKNIFFLVIFNNPFYSNIPYINSLYGKIFKYMAFCGPKPAPDDFQGIFIEYVNTENDVAGAFSYICSNILLSMQHKFTKGLLVIADDILFNIHRISDLSLSKIWLPPVKIGDIRKGTECKLGMCDFRTSWRWWKDYKTQTIKSITDLLKSDNPYLRTCVRNIQILTGNEFYVYGGYSDIYFIPYFYSKNFIQLTNHFLLHSVFVEIAVPISLYCQDPSQENVYTIKGLADWTLSRDEPWRNLERFDRDTYLHPVKWSYMTKENKFYPDWQRLYCKSVAYINDFYSRKSILS